MIREIEKQTEVQSLIMVAKNAQRTYADFTQEQVDKIVTNISKRLTASAEYLANKAQRETGFGNVADKTTKNLFASEHVYASLKDTKTVGVVKRDEENHIIEVAHPMGVIAALVPVTNPTSTVIFKALLALKTRNAIVFSPHPNAINAIIEAARLVEEAAVEAGAPAGLIQVITKPSIEATESLMTDRDTALILATGGSPMVRAAYSSGNPTIGVGAGNGPAFIETSADIKDAVSKIIESKTFDFGTICASEQSIVVEEQTKTAVIEELKEQKAYFLNETESKSIANLLLNANGSMNPAVIGKPAHYVANLAGIIVPENTSVLIAETEEVSRENPYSREKLTPVLGMFTVKNWEEGLSKVNEILTNEGLGHTAVLHTLNKDLAEEFGLTIKASRNLINTPGTFGGIGLSTRLAPSLTLGCGTSGGSSLTDNVAAKHLLNINRVAYHFDA